MIKSFEQFINENFRGFVGGIGSVNGSFTVSGKYRRNDFEPFTKFNISSDDWHYVSKDEDGYADETVLYSGDQPYVLFIPHTCLDDAFSGKSRYVCGICKPNGMNNGDILNARGGYDEATILDGLANNIRFLYDGDSYCENVYQIQGLAELIAATGVYSKVAYSGPEAPALNALQNAIVDMVKAGDYVPGYISGKNDGDSTQQINIEFPNVFDYINDNVYNEIVKGDSLMNKTLETDPEGEICIIYVNDEPHQFQFDDRDKTFMFIYNNESSFLEPNSATIKAVNFLKRKIKRAK